MAARAIGTSLLARMRDLAEEVASTKARLQPRRPRHYLVTCEAEWSRLGGESDPNLWERAAEAWHGLEMPYQRAYALMREGEAALARRDRATGRRPP